MHSNEDPVQPKINKLLKKKPNKQTEELPPTSAQEGEVAYQRAMNLKSVPPGLASRV